MSNNVFLQQVLSSYEPKLTGMSRYTEALDITCYQRKVTALSVFLIPQFNQKDNTKSSLILNVY